jgi:hypothetical protein
MCLAAEGCKCRKSCTTAYLSLKDKHWSVLVQDAGTSGLPRSLASNMVNLEPSACRNEKLGIGIDLDSDHIENPVTSSDWFDPR